MGFAAEIQELLVRIRLDDKLTSGVNKALSSTNKLESGMGRATKGAGQLGKGILKAGAVAAVAAGAGLAFAAHKAIEMDDAFATVRKNVEGTEPELAALKDQLHALATRIPVSFDDLAAIASEAGALGIATKDVVRFTDTMARLSASTQGLTVEAASEAFGKFRNSLHLTENEIERSASALIKLGRTAGSSEGDIIEVAKRFAGAGHTAGLSAPQILGLSSAIASLGVQPEAAGGSLSRLFNKINLFIGTGDKKLKVFAKTAGLTADQFKKAFGQDALGTFEKFLAGLSKLSGPEQQARLAAAGVVNIRDISALQLLAGSWQEVAKETGNATVAYQANNEVAEVSAKRFDTIKSKLQVLKNNFTEAAYNIAQGFLPALGRAADKLTAFLQLPETKKSLQDLGKKLGETLDKVDWDQLLTAAKSAVDVLQPMLDALLSIAGVLNKLPASVKGVALGAFVANKASGGLIGAGIGNIVGGLGSSLAKSLAASIPLFGRAFVQPVFVTNMIGGGLGGGLPGAAGGALEGVAAGGLGATVLTVGLTGGAIAALTVAFISAMQQHPDHTPGKENLTPSQGGDVFAPGHGFGRPGAGHRQRTDVTVTNTGSIGDVMGKAFAPLINGLKGVEAQNKVQLIAAEQNHLNKLGSRLNSLQQRLHQAQEQHETARAARLRSRVDTVRNRIDRTNSKIQTLIGVTSSVTVSIRDFAYSERLHNTVAPKSSLQSKAGG